MLGKAAEVVGVDLDEQAIALAKQNANLNQVRITFTQNDLFAWLRDLLPSGNRFDVLVLDPAKMTRDRDSIDLALKKYLDMNRLAMHAVEAPMPMDVTYEVEPDDGQARARVRVQGDAGRLYRVAAPIIGGQVRRSITGDVRRLKRILEHQNVEDRER